MLMDNFVEQCILVKNYNTLNEEYSYDKTEEPRLSILPRTLHDFLFHLSSPSDPTGKKKGMISEVTVLDTVGNKSPHKAMNLPKTSAIINKAREEGLGEKENLHKKIGAGFRKAFDEMSTEHPSETKRKLKEAREAFKSFAHSRGLKTAPSMLRGNMKTEKSSGEGVLTTGLNLAPHATSGLNNFDVCPKASSECRKNCLGTEAGGNKQFPDAALASKVFKTHFIAAHPEHAARLLDHEISQHARQAKKKGMIPGVRLNITSDFAWEHHAPKMFERHKDVQFYDYTKMPNRVLRSLAPSEPGSPTNRMGHPNNYHLSLSHTGSNHPESNDKDVSKVLAAGGVVASVFKRGKGNKLPTHVVDHATGRRYPVVNGDDDDNTFDRHTTSGLTEKKPHQGVVSGLILKGVDNKKAGHFANSVDENGEAHINKSTTHIRENVTQILKRVLKENRK